MRMKNWLPDLPLLLLIILPLLTYWQTLQNAFVWDDDVHIVYNAYDYPNQEGGILKYWSPKPKLIYAPLTYTIWGLLKTDTAHPMPFHLLNVLAVPFVTLIIFSTSSTE